MTAKQYLKQIYELDGRIQRRQERCNQIHDEMYSIGSPAGSLSPDKVQSSGDGRSIEHLISLIDKEERGIIADMTQMIELRAKICAQVEMLGDERYRMILFERYVMLHQWDFIADKMHYSRQHIYRLHDDAIAEFEKMLHHVTPDYDIL